MPQAGQTASVLIPGSAGSLETLIQAPTGLARGIAVICHPHPLAGGALSNKVTYSLASILHKAGFYAVRFNFRGVGASAGGHDHGRGETEDVVTVARWVQERAGPLPLLLAGFSFGGFVSLNAAQHLHPALLLSVAPPFGKYFEGAPPPPHPGCPWLVVHSRDDDVVPFADTAATLATYAPAPELAVLDGAGHFFHGRLTELQALVDAFVRGHWHPGAAA